jgi:cytochrome c556
MRSFVAWGLVVGLTLVVATKSVVAAPPEAPKVSTFAPAEDLANQVTSYIKELNDEVATEAEYKASDTAIAKQSNTLVVLALALALHDTDNPYKASAGALMQAAQEVAAAKNYAEAKKGVDKLASASGGSSPSQWEKAAALEQLMKQVPTVHNKLKKGVKGTKFKSAAKATAGQSAALAAIAQASMFDTSATKNNEEVKQWYEFCTKMRGAAARVNADIHQHDAAATEKAMVDLNQSCEDCHAVFKKDKDKDAK